jgi:protein gp37
LSTGIQWTDETWNPVVGCDRVSPGCAHCYAKHIHDLRHKASLAGKKVAPQYAVPFETVQLMPERLDQPLTWRRPRRVFVNSVADLFHDAVPDDFIDRVFAIMALTSWHTHQVLTKRPARALAYLSAPERRAAIAHAVEVRVRNEPRRPGRFDGVLGDLVLWREREDARFQEPTFRMSGISDRRWPLPNVWLGASVENQRFADERIPLLLQTPAAVRFLSCEPLLGPVDLTAIREQIASASFVTYSALDQNGREIVGGESGTGARPCNVYELTDVVAQCDFAGVPCFVKQMGARPVTPDLTHWRCDYTLLPDASGYALKLRDSHGGDPDEWPAELRVRQFPSSEVRA